MRNLIRSLAVILSCSALYACPVTGPGTVDSLCGDVFEDPGFAVQGKRLRDKQWIGKTQEKGITICGWKRPTGAGV